MAILTFTLSPDGVVRIHDALVCLGRFSETVSIEATHDKVRIQDINHSGPRIITDLFQLLLTTLNSSKSAYASFTFFKKTSFLRYCYQPVRGQGIQPSDRFSCKLYNKVEFSSSTTMVTDPSRLYSLYLEGA